MQTGLPKPEHHQDISNAMVLPPELRQGNVLIWGRKGASTVAPPTTQVDKVPWVFKRALQFAQSQCCSLFLLQAEENSRQIQATVMGPYKLVLHSIHCKPGSLFEVYQPTEVPLKFLSWMVYYYDPLFWTIITGYNPLTPYGYNSSTNKDESVLINPYKIHIIPDN